MKVEPDTWRVQIPSHLFSQFETGQRHEIRFGTTSIPVRVTEAVPPDTIVFAWIDTEGILQTRVLRNIGANGE